MWLRYFGGFATKPSNSGRFQACWRDQLAAVQEPAKCLAQNAMPPLHWIQLLRFLP